MLKNNNNKREALISNYPNPAHKKKKFSKQQIAGSTSYSFVKFFFFLIQQ